MLVASKLVLLVKFITWLLELSFVGVTWQPTKKRDNSNKPTVRMSVSLLKTV